jgi:oxaloacetate decarboxylase alpha subunit
MDEAGYWNIGITSCPVFDACIYYLAEDPWERLDIAHRLAPRTRKSCVVRALVGLGWKLYADDVFDLIVKTMARHGIGLINPIDALNDTSNMAPTIKASLDAGLHVVGCIVFTESPVHTDDHFVDRAKELVALGVHGVQIKDSGALLTPNRVRTLVPAMRQAIGDDIELHFHTHCNSGLGPLATLEALPLGIDVVHTAISPLANGSSQPATEMIAREARNMGFEVPLDFEKIEAQAAHFRAVAKSHNKPIGQAMAYDPAHFRHQIPGGMLSNMISQMGALGLSDELPRVLDEIVRIREELGWPIVVSPISQFIAVQAIFNVMHGQRYRSVPEGLKEYALGWYGQTPAPIDPDVFDRITDGEEPISERPGALMEPMVDKFRAEHGPFASDEELILALHYEAGHLEEWRKARADAIGYPTPKTPLATLIKELGERPDVTYVQVSKGADRVTYVA